MVTYSSTVIVYQVLKKAKWFNYYNLEFSSLDVKKIALFMWRKNPQDFAFEKNGRRVYIPMDEILELARMPVFEKYLLDW